jgi:hypothetical protein
VKVVAGYHIEGGTRLEGELRVQGAKNAVLPILAATLPGGVSKELYNLSFEGAAYADVTIPLERRIPAEEPYTLTINDGDDRPIAISGVTVRYYADELIFEGAGGESYKLEFGADESKTAPVYDIARYSDKILRGNIDRVALGEIAYTSKQPEQRDYTAVFNAVIVVVALMLGAVFLTRLRKN